MLLRLPSVVRASRLLTPHLASYKTHLSQSSCFVAPQAAAAVTSSSSSSFSSPLFGSLLLCRTKTTKTAEQIAGELAGIIKEPKLKRNSRRHYRYLDKQAQGLWAGRPVRALTKGLRKSGGRDNTGRMRVESRGGGHKHLYRFIDFKRSAVLDEQAIVQRIEYDPNRNAHIALLTYGNGVLSYIIAPESLKAGDSCLSSRTKELDLKPGNAMPISNIPIGTIIHNVELHPGHGGQLARAAGTSCTIINKNGRPGYALLEMCSKEQKYIPLACMASIGIVSNPLHKLIKLGKAGRARWAGRKPHVRGTARNPVDHPMGGGHSAKGRQPCSKFGVLSKGYKTRRKNKRNNFIVVPRGGIQKGEGGQFSG